MNSLFGLSMTYIAIACVILTLLIFVAVAWIAVRNPVMFKMGIRNIPRRPAQTTLIVIGLMLSTLIMSAAFGTGDTLTTSVTNEVYDIAGETDEIIRWDAEKQPAPVEQQVIPLAEIERWQAQFADDPDIEALAPFLQEQIPILNTRTQLNEPLSDLVGFRNEDLRTFGGLFDIDGNELELTPGEIVVNKSLADEIDAQPGDVLRLFYQGEAIEFTVKAIAPDSVLSGTLNTASKEGAVVEFAELTRITGKGENADAVLVSNHGGVKDGIDLTDTVIDKLEAAIGDQPYSVDALKRDNVEFAELLGNAFTTIFVVFGLFSIAAGVLLIFLIFVMLAAERKPEMGMARAVGAKRRQLVESFLAEGMGYDLGAALVGLVAGVGVTALMVEIIKAAAGDNLGVQLRLSVTPRSMITAFCLGVIATFIVIFASSWRASRLNITAAIRDLPETKPINPETATWRGYLRAALNGVIAFGLPVGLLLFLAGPIGLLLGAPLALIGLVSPWVYVLRGSNFALPRDHRTDEGPPKWPWILGLAIPVIGWFLILPWYFLALLLTRLVRDRRPHGLATWLVIAGIVVPPLGFVLVLLQNPRARIVWSTGLAFAFALAGVVMTFAGLDQNSQFLFFGGVSVLFLFAAETLRFFGIAERPSFTITSALLLLLWYLPTSFYEKTVGELNGDIEMFFLSGMVMVTAAVFIVVYNADIILPAIASVSSRFGRILPAIRTGIAYPLSARFRTGMTMIMIGLIMFSLVMMATMNTNFARVFLNDESRGGYDEIVQVNGNNLIDDFRGTLEQAGVDTSTITQVAELRVAYPYEAEVENRDQKEGSDDEIPEFLRYAVIGADNAFLETNAIEMKYLAEGYNSTEEVWAAIREDPTLAVIPASLQTPPDPIFSAQMGDDILQLDSLEDGFAPFTLRLRNPATSEETTITVIGVMKEAADTFLSLGPAFSGTTGIVTGIDTMTTTFPDAQGQRFYLSVADGVDNEEHAKSIEAALVQVSADSLQELLDEQQALQNGFLMVFQGFMGLGLIVGIAALAVVASRSVVERRQQIGMLRAIGYQRSMVALSFLFESGFIALSGIIIGLALGLSLAWLLFTSGEVGEEAKGAGFVVPWLNILIITGIAFAASMLMTFLPARQASKVPVAEALRYE